MNMLKFPDRHSFVFICNRYQLWLSGWVPENRI